ncbi:MAG: NAD-dependent epimerase/dehydratase [Candidatus Eremiobacteraeota bacterium]|jgi:nucleoside-diphosphate-sugar epimerase|nr:NAD-dependent epimerase/dehydratase [Candidatus Eremiobacteraeota bacterium]
MAVLVTGGAGFLGSHLVDRLVRDGNDVIIADNLSTGRISNVGAALATASATLVYVDVAAPAADLRAAIEGATAEPIDAIFHLASPASPEAYDANPWETLAVNALGTMSLVELALERNALMLFASTSEVYGDPGVHPQPEAYFGNVNPVGPRACYDEGKRFGEAAVSVAMRRRGLNGRIVRLFNCYGPRMDFADGRLVPALLAAATAGEPLPIHGSGLQTRSMTYVDDVIDGLMTVATSPAADEPVNLGSEEEHTVLEIAQEVAAAVGTACDVAHLPARPEDPHRRRPDITRARRLGWAPSTPLRDGLHRTYAWYRAYGLQYA